MQEIGFKLLHFVDRDIVQETVDTGVDRQHLICDRHRSVLPLLEQFHHPHAARKLRLRGLVELAAELRKRGHFAVLREVQAQRTGHLLHGLDLGRTTDA